MACSGSISSFSLLTTLPNCSNKFSKACGKEATIVSFTMELCRPILDFSGNFIKAWVHGIHAESGRASVPLWPYPAAPARGRHTSSPGTASPAHLE